MNNPLQGIIREILQLLIDHFRAGASGAARGCGGSTRRRIAPAAFIVRNLLVFSGSRRMTRGRKLRVDRVIRRAIASRRAVLGQSGWDRSFRSSTRSTRCLMISGDPLLLQQAFLNILINAEHVDRIPPSGSRGRNLDVTSGHRWGEGLMVG